VEDDLRAVHRQDSRGLREVHVVADQRADLPEVHLHDVQLGALGERTLALAERQVGLVVAADLPALAVQEERAVAVLPGQAQHQAAVAPRSGLAEHVKEARGVRGVLGVGPGLLPLDAGDGEGFREADDVAARRRALDELQRPGEVLLDGHGRLVLFSAKGLRGS
jgi:hypothetical protein